jgi:hypothetical protein
MSRRMRMSLRIVLALMAASTVSGAACAQTAAAGTALTITLDADAVEIVRASRRQRGLDPPDAAADKRVAALLQRLAATPSDDKPRVARTTSQPPTRANP